VGSLDPNIEGLTLDQPARHSPLPFEGSSEIEILNAVAEVLSPEFLDSLTGQFTPEPLIQDMPYLDSLVKTVEPDTRPPFLHRNTREQQGIIDEVCKTVIKDMDSYGICVVDNFLGLDKGGEVLHEVLNMYDKGVFKDGQLVSTRMTNNDLKTIRSDQIAWIDGKEAFCKNIGHLIGRVDAVILRANQMTSNGKLGKHTITGRTKVREYFGENTYFRNFHLN